MANKKALFLDRDGTLIQDAHYLKNPDQLEIIRCSGPALQKARDAGYLLFMHTNQSGIARGYYDLSDVNACNLRMHKEFNWPDSFFTEVCIAPESPDGDIVYRKPSPRFETEMIQKYNLIVSECWVVGDKWIDPQTGLNAGMKGALVRTGKPIDEELELKARQQKVPICRDLDEFVSLQLKL